MLIFLRALTVLLGHVLAAQAVGWSAYSWPECLFYGVAAGVLFAVGGFFYLVLEIPAAVVMFWAFDLCQSNWSRVLCAIGCAIVCSGVGYGISPPVGAGRLYPEGYCFAGLVFAATVTVAALLTGRRHTSLPPS